jgi:hypothetical protein
MKIKKICFFFLILNLILEKEYTSILDLDTKALLGMYIYTLPSYHYPSHKG